MNGQQDAKHKFDQPMDTPISYRELYGLRFATHFIPFLKILDRATGREQVIECLRELALEGAREYAEAVVEKAGKNDLSVFKAIYSPDNPDNPDLCNLLTVEVLESTDDVYRIKVTECLLAEVFRNGVAASIDSMSGRRIERVSHAAPSPRPAIEAWI
ncbi:L-2-amino-thiazoline-4-carboxylic acid hydrolase [Candidatus Bipolaricaulota bacterium]|nr:L-2-amino-thiazoline-4-carboxylic acid hydrolase [Candidatus Bipolaricaulota bacterium]